MKKPNTLEKRCMKPLLSILGCSLIMASVAVAQPGPNGPPPSFKIVTSTDPAKGHIVFGETVYRAVPVQREIVEIVNGQQVKRTVTEYVTVAESRETKIDATNSRVITTDGKQLPIDEVWKRLKANTVVVVSADSSTPSAAYLRALSAQTLVIVPGPMKK
jgi:hypothetical protein